MTEHPGLATVLWHQDDISSSRLERAEYRGHHLMVRHTGENAQWNLGYIDGKHVGTRSSMPRICQFLFECVDRMEDKAKQ